MTVERMDHVGIVVDDLAAAVAFFGALGLEPCGEARVEGQWVDRVVALEGVRAEIAMLQTPDGGGRVELAQFHAPAYAGAAVPAPSNAPGIRHVAFVVDDIDAALTALRAHGGELVGELERYRDVYRLCYVRGPSGVIVELAERIDRGTSLGLPPRSAPASRRVATKLVPLWDEQADRRPSL